MRDERLAVKERGGAGEMKCEIFTEHVMENNVHQRLRVGVQI